MSKTEKKPCYSNENGYLLAIPKDIQRLKENSPELVKEWRFMTRQIMLDAFEAGYILVDVQRSDGLVHYYALEK